MTNDICSVADCDTPIKRVGLCYGHYMKQWRYGTPTPTHAPTWVDLTGERFGTLVVVERVASAWLCRCDCGEHRKVGAGNLNRTKDASTCGVKANHLREDVGYSAVHYRVKGEHGAARDYPCVQCGQPAAEWAYDHADPDEMWAIVEGTPNPVPYSAQREHYQPMCRSCHSRLDARAARGRRADV